MRRCELETFAARCTVVVVAGVNGLPEVDEWLESVRLTPDMDIAAFVTAARQLDNHTRSDGVSEVDGHLTRRFREGRPPDQAVALAALRARGVRLYSLTDGRTIVSRGVSAEGPVRPSVAAVTYEQLSGPLEVRVDIEEPKVGPASRWLTRRVMQWAMRRSPPPTAPD
jgi:hypothetical protein